MHLTALPAEEQQTHSYHRKAHFNKVHVILPEGQQQLTDTADKHAVTKFISFQSNVADIRTVAEK